MTPKVARARAGAGEALLLAPILIIMAVVIAVPTVSVVFHAFTDWQPGYESPWVGLDNFTYLYHSAQFREILLNHAVLLIGLPLWVIAPLVIAFMLYEGVPCPGLFRAIFFFPTLVAPALIGVLFAFLLAPQGPLNATLRSVGLDPLAQAWLSDAHLVKPVIIVVLAWATIGTGVVIFSAGLSSVPPEQFEAAEVDGATSWQRVHYVALPNLKRLIELWAVILVISAFVSVFPWIFTLTRGGPGFASTTLDYDIYQNALSFGYFGQAAAESVSLLLIVFAIVCLGALLFKVTRSKA